MFIRTLAPNFAKYARSFATKVSGLPPKRVAVTGAAGQVAYSILFRIASGDLLGPNTRVVLQLIDQPGMDGALKGVKMELEDGGFPLLDHIETATKLGEGFKDADYAFLIGARPRGPGMERKDLLLLNAEIFAASGQAINDTAKSDIKVLVVGNPCNTNCMICSNMAPKVPKENFTALTKLDHNRAKFQLAYQVGCPVADISQICIWGNHSPTMYPDIRNTLIKRRSALAMLEADWVTKKFIPTVQTRGAEVIKARKLSSAASAGNAALEHMREWILGSQDWTSFAVVTEKDNPYKLPEGIVFSFPVTVEQGKVSIVPDVAMPDPLSQSMIKRTTEELVQEREAVASIMRK